MTSLKSGSAPDKKRKWYLYDQMLFLLPYTVENKTTSNLSDLSDHEEEVSGQPNTSISPALETTITTNDMVTPTSGIAGPSSVEKRQKKRAKFPQERALASTLDKEIFTAIQNISTTSSKSVPEDEDELFFKSLIPKMKTLDPITKWELQAEIQMLVLRYVKDSGRRYQTSSSCSRPHFESSGSPTFSNRRTVHPPAHPQQGGHYGLGAPSPVPMPPQNPGRSGSAPHYSNFTIAPSPTLSQCPSNSGSTTPSADYESEHADSYRHEQYPSYHTYN